MPTAVFDNPYSLGDGKEAPFLSSIIFKDPARHIQREGWRFQFIDSSAPHFAAVRHTKKHSSFNQSIHVDLQNSRTELYDDDDHGADASSVGGLPSRIDHLPNSFNATTDQHVEANDDVDSHYDQHIDDTATAFRVPEDPPVPFRVRMEELERRMHEQLEIHRQLNSALSTLDTVSLGVRNATSDDAVATMLQRRHEAAVQALNTGAVPPPCHHTYQPPQQNASPAWSRPTPVIPAQVVPKVAAPSVVAVVNTISTNAATKSKSSKSAQVEPPRPKTAIVRPAHEDPVPYMRKVLRPKPTVASASPLNPGKSVSIAGATSVTHYDRDSPPLSAARRPLLSASVDTIRDSVRISSSMEGRDTIRTSSQYSSPLYESTAVSSSLQRSDSSLSNIRIAFVDRNLATTRRSGSGIRSSVDEDLITIMSDNDDTSSDTMIREDSFGNSTTMRSTIRESFDSFRGAAGGGLDPGGKQPKQLFEMFHRLCVRATNAIEHLEGADTSKETPSEHNLRPTSANKKSSAVVEDVRDVMRLQHFIKVLTDDVKRLESIRKARVAKEKLLKHAKKVATARRRMQQNKKLSLEEVEDEIGIALSPSIRRRRGDQDDIVDDDDIPMDASFDEDIRSDGIEEDMIEDEWGDDMNHIDDDDEIMDEFGDNGDDDDGMPIMDDLDEDALAATAMLQAEEDLADYLLDNDADDILGSPPAQLRLIRYGGAKQAADRRQGEHGASVPRPESDRPSSRSGSSSFYSSVEDEEEVALMDRRRAAASAPRAEEFPASAVEEDEALARLGERHRSTRNSSASSRSSSIHSVTSIRTSLQSGGTDVRFHGGSGQRSDAMPSPLKRGMSRKFTSAQLKKQKSAVNLLHRQPSAAPGAMRHRSVSPTVSEEDSFVRSSSSSGDADLASSHDPFSTPYTTCTTVDSSVEIAPMPSFARSVANQSGIESRKFIDRQKWMETEKRRRKALRSVVPMHTLTSLYDPCESTPSGGNSSNDSPAKGKKPTGTASNRPNVARAALKESAPNALQLDQAMLTMRDGGDGGMVSEGSFAALSPMSVASPALAGGAGHERVTMLMAPAEFQKLTSAGPSTSRYSAPRQDSDEDNSDTPENSDGDDHRTPRSPPRGITETPPPPALSRLSAFPDVPAVIDLRDEPPDATPMHSMEWSSQHVALREGAPSVHSLQLHGSLQGVGLGLSSPFMNGGGATRASMDVDGDHVQLGGQSPLPEDAAPPRDYPVDDLVAIDAWKVRQVAAIRDALLLPADDAKGTPMPPDVEERKWAEEASVHWAALETLLESRFGRSPESSYGSASFTTGSSTVSDEDDGSTRGSFVSSDDGKDQASSESAQTTYKGETSLLIDHPQ